eukprot:2109460-Prymnesium_polylepis.2
MAPAGSARIVEALGINSHSGGQGAHQIRGRRRPESGPGALWHGGVKTARVTRSVELPWRRTRPS